MQIQASTGDVTVEIPAALRFRTGDSARVVVAGGTVRDVIVALEERFSGIRFNLCLETGELRPFVNVFVNGENVRYLDGLDTDVPAGATVHIFPSVAGG